MTPTASDTLPLHNILRELSEDSGLLAIPVSDALCRLLTLGGRVHRAAAEATLALRDKQVLLHTRYLKNVRLSRASSADPSFVVYFSVLGRLHIRPSQEPLVTYGIQDDPIVVGYFALPDSALVAIERATQKRPSIEVQIGRRFERALEEIEHVKSLDSVIDNVIDAVQHVEAINWYFNDRLYAVAERLTNLVDTKRRKGLLTDLRGRCLADWPVDQKLLVAFLHCLYLSGKSIRFEEFNGTDINARLVFARLRFLARAYNRSRSNARIPQTHPFELARSIARSVGQFIGSDLLRYRKTNGISFRKTEHLLSIEGGKHYPHCRSALDRLEDEWLGSVSRSPLAIKVAQLTDYAIGELGNSERLPVLSKSKIEILIETIVSSAVVSTNADYGMSSSLRAPHLLYSEESQHLPEAILSLTPKDFFCCIVATEHLALRYGDHLSADVFRPVQARMQYNRWHFIAGNLPRGTIGKDRHFFYPPTMPDIAEWSDQFHAGHALAGVRYAIRAPGPDSSLPPLYIAGLAYRGFYDCRVVRTNGDPFEIEDLKTVTSHSRLIGVLWARLVFHCERQPDLRQRLILKQFQNGTGSIISSYVQPGRKNTNDREKDDAELF